MFTQPLPTQADKFNLRTVKGAYKPKKYMLRAEAEAEVERRNARPMSQHRTKDFGNGCWRVQKDGPINAPFWTVVEVR